MSRLHDGNEDAYTELFRRYRDPLLRYFFGHGCSRPDAEDLIQEVFVCLFKVRRKLNPGKGNIQSFLLGITKKVLLKKAVSQRMAKSIIFVATEVLEKIQIGNFTASEVAARELMDDIRREAGKLSRMQQRVFTLLYLRGISEEKAAKRLRISLENLRRTERLALRKLKKHLIR